MSFEVYLQCFDNCEPAGIARRTLHGLFAEGSLNDSEQDSWRLKYDALNSCDLHLTALESNPDLVHAVGVHRPCGDLRLWQALFELMKHGHWVLYWPGDSPPLTLVATTKEHLPESMLEALGIPIAVRDVEEIRERIKNS